LSYATYECTPEPEPIYVFDEQAEVDGIKTTLQEDKVEIEALTDALSRAQDECRELKKVRAHLEVSCCLIAPSSPSTTSRLRGGRLLQRACTSGVNLAFAIGSRRWRHWQARPGRVVHLLSS
jgi:hypothetical protein